MQHTIANNTNPSPGNNRPDQSLLDKTISSIMNIMGVLSFFGVTGQDVTKWIVDSSVWLITHGLWIFNQFGNEIQQLIRGFPPQ